jgi:hypothetical protein
MELKEIIYQLEKQYPNNMEFGDAVRKLVWQMKEAQSKSIADEQLPGQIDMFANE